MAYPKRNFLLKHKHLTVASTCSYILCMPDQLSYVLIPHKSFYNYTNLSYKDHYIYGIDVWVQYEETIVKSHSSYHESRSKSIFYNIFGIELLLDLRFNFDTQN